MLNCACISGSLLSGTKSDGRKAKSRACQRCKRNNLPYAFHRFGTIAFRALRQPTRHVACSCCSIGQEILDPSSCGEPRQREAAGSNGIGRPRYRIAASRRGDPARAVDPERGPGDAGCGSAVRGLSIKEIARELHVSRNTIRKILRSGETAFEYERRVQPQPKVGPWRDDLDRLLAVNPHFSPGASRRSRGGLSVLPRGAGGGIAHGCALRGGAIEFGVGWWR